MRYLPGLLLLAACGNSPADVTGTYTTNLTNHDNGCSFTNWTVGNVTQGIQFTVTQENDTASASVSGAAGSFLDLWIGAHVFSGSVDGNDVDLTITGSTPHSMGNCAYTLNSELIATLDGNTLNGEVHYLGQTNGGSDCGTLTACVSVQAMNGTRPPP